MSIRGCKVKLEGSLQREFVLPVWSKIATEGRPLSIDMDAERIKHSGFDVDRRHSSLTSVEAPSDLSFLQCSVLPAQPLMCIKSTSLTHDALMLYEGERYDTINIIAPSQLMGRLDRTDICIHLENISALSVTHLDVSFKDEYSSATLDKLQDHEVDLSPGQAFELDRTLRCEPVFKWRRPDVELCVEPGQQITLRVECFGKLEW